MIEDISSAPEVRLEGALCEGVPAGPSSPLRRETQ